MTDRPALPDIPVYAPKPGTQWRHIATREIYGVLAVAYRESDLTLEVVYTRARLVWIRPLDNFLERFKPRPIRIVGSCQRRDLAKQVQTLGADSLLPDWKPSERDRTPVGKK